MGYELDYLLGEIDDEFLCSICTMVLENPVQSPCEHTFCNDCIKQWLKVKSSCPVDACLLALADIKPTPRFFRNLLDKVEVMCDFGCQTIVPLGQLKHHLAECVFNPNAEVICDKGCNIKITQEQYEAANCFTHLANRQRDEIMQLSDELNDVRCEVSRSANVIELQSEEITKLTDVVSRQQDEITKLNDGVGRQLEHFIKLTNKGSMQLEEITSFGDEIDQQRDEIANLSDDVDQQRNEIASVDDEMSSVCYEVTRFENVFERQNEEITKLTDKCNMQRDEITKISDDLRKLIDEGNMQREDITKLNDEVRRFTILMQSQQEEITELNDSDDVGRQRKDNMDVIDGAISFGKSILKWQTFKNMKSFIDRPHVLEHGECGFSFAQTSWFLKPASSSFKIRVLNASKFIVIGLTPFMSTEHSNQFPGYYDNTIGYHSTGELICNGVRECGKAVENWRNGDVIECAIKFPDNFENDGKTNVEVYFSLNKQVAVKKVMVMPRPGLFPTVSMWQELREPKPRVEFLNLI